MVIYGTGHAGSWQQGAPRHQKKFSNRKKPSPSSIFQRTNFLFGLEVGATNKDEEQALTSAVMADHFDVAKYPVEEAGVNKDNTSLSADP